MSTTQSHIQTGPQSTFSFNPSQRLTQMNARPEVIRQPGVPQVPQMAMNFMGNRQQPEQHGQPPMGMLSGNNSNPPMNVLGVGPPGNGSSTQVAPSPRFQQQLQQANQHQRHQSLLQQSHSAQSMNPSGVSTSGPPMGGPGPNQMGMGFPGNMLQQQPGSNPQVRRAPSQPQSLNQSVGHPQMGGGAIHPGPGAMPMGMNAQTSVPAQLRQATQQQQINNLRMQQMPGQVQGMSPEMTMGMRPGNPGMPQNGQRSASAQTPIMSNQQPGLAQAHLAGMQPNVFPNPMSHPHQTSQTTSPSPRLGSRSQPHTPANMNIPNPGQQPHANRSQGDMFNFQNPQFPQGIPNNAGRSNSSQFPFVPSSTSPPNHHGDIPQAMGSLNSNNRPGGFPTPAQQLQSGEGYNGHFSMPPPQSNIPPRPPSNNSHPPLHQHQQQSPHHISSQQQDHLAAIAPQRPQSQPQNQSGRPPSQSGPSNTPRTPHAQLPGHTANPSAGRMPLLNQQGGQQGLHQPQSASGHPLPIAPRPPQTVPTLAGPPSAAFLSSEGGPSQGQPGGPQRPGNIAGYPLGVGQGLTRILQFSGSLATDNKTRLSLTYWEGLVREYFAPQAIMKFTLWKDNQRNEAKPFDIGVPILPRFFLVTAQSGVKSMSLSLDGARERLISQHHAIIECVTAAWTYRYTNGYTVTLRGPLTAHVVLVPNSTRSQGVPTQPSQPFSLKFESLDFGANFHDKSISLESIMGHRNPESSPPKTPHTRNAPTPNANGATSLISEDDKKWEEPRVTIERASIPGEPVNAFGIPQATMRCLELAESVGQMSDLIAFADSVGQGPIDGLKMYAAKLREAGSVNLGQGINGPVNGFQNFQALNGVNPSPAVTLYSSVPPPTNAPSSSQPTPSTPQNAPPSANNSPRKQHKTVPQAPGSASTPTQTSGSVSTTGTSASTNTSSISNSLKRKQTDAASPITGPEPPAKRATRKRGRGGGG